jgi:hypothetical protein
VSESEGKYSYAERLATLVGGAAKLLWPMVALFVGLEALRTWSDVERHRADTDASIARDAASSHSADDERKVHESYQQILQGLDTHPGASPTVSWDPNEPARTPTVNWDSTRPPRPPTFAITAVAAKPPGSQSSK